MTDQEKTLEAVLRRYTILDAELENEFHDVVRLTSKICETPVTLITLADRDHLRSDSTIWRDAAELPPDLSVGLDPFLPDC